MFWILRIPMALLFLWGALPAYSALSTPILNLQQIQQNLKLSVFYGYQANHEVRIAVLDRGFKGYEEAIGKSLPESTKYFPGPVENAAQSDTPHGLVMAQIVSGLLDSLGVPFRLELHNAAGFSNLKAAVERVEENRVDLVLYSEVWDYGNNNDGRGFINKLISQGAKKRIWINAAGNFAKTTYNTPISVLEEDWVGLPDENTALKLICKKNSQAENKTCPVRITASWNDFSDDLNQGTQKDIDIALFDDFMSLKEKAALIQSDDPEELKKPGRSRYPREIIATELTPGTYYIKAKARSKNFNVARDRLRITVGGEFVQLPRHDRFESLHNPADNPLVITVGASDSDRSSRSRRLQKPEVQVASSVKVKEGEYLGSSNSAAMVAAVGATWISITGERDRAQLLQFLQWMF